MKQPSKKETKKEYDRLKKLTKSGRYTAFNPIKIIATETETEYKLSPNQIKNRIDDTNLGDFLSNELYLFLDLDCLSSQ